MVEKVFKVYEQLLLRLKPLMAPHLQELVGIVMDVFERHRCFESFLSTCMAEVARGNLEEGESCVACRGIGATSA